MLNRWVQAHTDKKRLLSRLDRMAGELNAFLLVLAIGLAVLDLTCFFAFEMRDSLRTAARLRGQAPVTATMISPIDQPAAVVAPPRPAVTATGW